jgi:hypothetical protein
MDRLAHALAWTKSTAGLEAYGVSLRRQRKVQSNTSNRRYAKDVGFRMRSKFMGKLAKFMRAALLIDKRTWFGCSQWELRSHIQAQFRHGMTWQNYGKLWEIDHVCPVGRFNLPAEIFSCFHFTNLRPRLRVSNRIDGKLFQQRLTYGQPFRNLP